MVKSSLILGMAIAWGLAMAQGSTRGASDGGNIENPLLENEERVGELGEG